MVAWLELPVELTAHIAKHLLSHDLCDFIKFGSVCRHWRSITTDKRLYSTTRPQVPWLIYFHEFEANAGNHRTFSLSTKKRFTLHLPTSINDSQVWGSPHGWLIIHQHPKTYLYNPITSRAIHLPDTHRCAYVARAMLFLSPSSSSSSSFSSLCHDNFIVIMFVMHPAPRFEVELVMARHGDKTWTTIRTPFIRHGFRSDVICVKNKFYAVINDDGALITFDVHDPLPTISEFFQPIEKIICPASNKYLVDVSGDIHMVEETAEHGKISLSIFKMNLYARKWDRLSGSGDHAIFFEDNYRTALLASCYPQLQRNCLYKNGMFLSDDAAPGYDPYEISEFRDGAAVYTVPHSPYTWITPNLW